MTGQHEAVNNGQSRGDGEPLPQGVDTEDTPRFHDQVLTVREMATADRLTIASGTSSYDLMAAAGRAVAEEITAHFSLRPVVVLCGPGDNGGDGFVVARHLAEAGWPVRVAALEAPRASEAAAAHARAWNGQSVAASPQALDFATASPLVVDALFGAGLDRPLTGSACALIEEVNARALPCIGVDIPSGVHGDTGAVLGVAARCALTVTFFRAKPGHYLLPGRALCGTLRIRDIGIADAVLRDIRPKTMRNTPRLWESAFPVPDSQGHKYHRGHAVIAGGSEMIGAARLAARAARRVGAGVVTIAAPDDAFPLYAVGEPGNLVARAADAGSFATLLQNARRGAVLIGPGCGREAGAGARTRALALGALETGMPTVLDADALSVFAQDPETVFSAVGGALVLTPHDGEFARLFADIDEGSKLERARTAARRSGGIVVLKGADTVIAAPDGRAAINTSAPPTLATAGSGDVLAGILTGLLAQGMPPFAAAQCAVWLHGRAAQCGGWGLIAEDIVALLPRVLARIERLKTIRRGWEDCAAFPADTKEKAE